MKTYLAYTTPGLFAFLAATGCGGSVSSAPLVDGGATDAATDAATSVRDSASTPDAPLARADSASTPDTGRGDATTPVADAMQPQPGSDATLPDASGGDATTPSDDAAPGPDGTPAVAEDSSYSEDSAMSEDDSAVGDGGSCQNFTTGNPTCDTCILANCCAEAAACNTGGNNTGITACEQIVSCVEDTCADGGILGECLLTCAPDEISPADAVLTCLSTSCSTECN